MKKIVLLLLALPLLVLTACGSNTEEISYVGVNAEIIEISSVLDGVVVKGLDQDSILGEECYISFENPETYFLHVDYSTGEVTDIQFKDLAVGDSISIDVKTVENKYALATRAQLLNQEDGSY